MEKRLTKARAQKITDTLDKLRHELLDARKLYGEHPKTAEETEQNQDLQAIAFRLLLSASDLEVLASKLPGKPATRR